EVRGARVCISGDLDLLRTKDLRWAIAAVADDEVELDLSGVAFVGWTGLEVLLDARLDHPLLRITVANDRVLAVLEASGTAGYLMGFGSGANGASPSVHRGSRSGWR